MKLKVYAGNMYVGTLDVRNSGYQTFTNRHGYMFMYWVVMKYKKLSMIGPKLQEFRKAKSYSKYVRG